MTTSLETDPYVWANKFNWACHAQLNLFAHGLTDDLELKEAKSTKFFVKPLLWYVPYGSISLSTRERYLC